MIDPPDIHYIDRIETVDQSSNDDAASSDTPAKPIKLGDFSKLFAEFLDSPQHRYDPDPDPLERSDYDDDYSPARMGLKPASLSSTPSSCGPEQAPPAKRSHTSIIKHDPPYRDIKPIPPKGQNTNSHYAIASSPPDLSTSASQYASYRSCICGRGASDGWAVRLLDVFFSRMPRMLAPGQYRAPFSVLDEQAPKQRA
ncbi:hypothetical protein TrVGV298_003750 [Trichoderma virens]|nr:hypothetical protein TrVGV298_003750 [Trichoderma virens]